MFNQTDCIYIIMIEFCYLIKFKEEGVLLCKHFLLYILVLQPCDQIIVKSEIIIKINVTIHTLSSGTFLCFYQQTMILHKQLTNWQTTIIEKYYKYKQIANINIT